MRIQLGEHMVDLEGPVRLIKPARQGMPAFQCEGVLAEAPTASIQAEDVLRVTLTFHGGATAEWVPIFGDVLMNVED